MVQPRKTGPFIFEKMLMGRKESIKQNKNKHNFTDTDQSLHLYRLISTFTARCAETTIAIIALSFVGLRRQAAILKFSIL